MEDATYASLYSRSATHSPSDSPFVLEQPSTSAINQRGSVPFDIGNIGDALPPSSAPRPYGWQQPLPTTIPLSGMPPYSISPLSLTVGNSNNDSVEQHRTAPMPLEEAFPFSEYTTVWSPQPAFRTIHPSASHTNHVSSQGQQRLPGQTKSFRPASANRSVVLQSETAVSAITSASRIPGRTSTIEDAMPKLDPRSRSYSQSSNDSLSASQHESYASRRSAFGPAETLTEEEKKKRNRESSQRFRNRTRERQNAMKNRMQYLEEKVKALEQELAMYRFDSSHHAVPEAVQSEPRQLERLQRENEVLKERLNMAEIQIRALTSATSPQTGPSYAASFPQTGSSHGQHSHSRQASTASICSSISSRDSWSSRSSLAHLQPLRIVDPSMDPVNLSDKADSEVSSIASSSLSRSSSLQSHPSTFSASSQGPPISLSLAYRKPQSLVLPPLAGRSVSAGYASTNFASIATPTLRTRFPEHNLSSAPPSQANYGFTPASSNDGPSPM